MAHYIEFDTPDGPILIEVDVNEITPHSGRIKAGLGEVVDNTVAKAQKTFQSALKIVRQNASAFIQEMQDMDFAPDEVEITFGLKATGEFSNFAVGKLGGESNYSVKVKWTRKVKATAQEHS